MEVILEEDSDYNESNVDANGRRGSEDVVPVSPTRSECTSPSSGRSSRALKSKGWTKIKRELITNNKEKVKESNPNDIKKKNEMLSIPKSPLLGSKQNKEISNSNVNNSEPKRGIRLLVLGQDGVGKSAFIVRYLTGRYIGEYDPQLEGIFKRRKNVHNQEIMVECKDTTCGINWPNRRNDLIWTDTVIFIYSITNRNSFNEIKKITNAITNDKNLQNSSCLVIGNKQDLSHLRTVQYTEGHDLAQSINGAFLELSVANDYHDLERHINSFINAHFQSLKLVEKQQKQPTSRSTPDIKNRSQPEENTKTTDINNNSSDADDTKSEKKGRMLWQKLKTNSELKKSKK